MNKELVFLRTFAIAMVIGMVFIVTWTMKKSGNQKFGEIDVERINIVEKDGTVKLIITNLERFPTGQEKVNERVVNEQRKKTSGMIFYNEDGIECGGLIYAGMKNEAGHKQWLSLTYDQYDGDQVMQLLTMDYRQGDQRIVGGGLMFNDRAPNETQIKGAEIAKELQELEEKNPQEAEKKYKEYREQGLIGSVTRLMLGNLSRDKNNGLRLFDDKGRPRAMFYVDKENNAKLEFFDEEGNTIASFPENK
jgi:hypothetical protein